MGQFVRNCVLVASIGGVLLFSGCASLGESVTLGGGIGGGVGTLVGVAAKGDSSNFTPVAIGAVAGIAAGSLMGYLAHKDRERKAATEFKKVGDEWKTPAYLGDAEVDHIWIPPKIEGNRAVDGYYMHIIKKPSGWRSK